MPSGSPGILGGSNAVYGMFPTCGMLVGKASTEIVRMRHSPSYHRPGASVGDTYQTKLSARSQKPFSGALLPLRWLVKLI